MFNAKTVVTTARRAARITNSLAVRGVVVEYVRKTTYSNLSFRCGRLFDGRVSYSYRWEIAGDTYPLRALLKAASFRWDSKARCWHSKDFTGYTADLGGNLIRELA